ncbi:tail fiber domain-containing protein [Halobacteriovorax sp. DPLXC-1]|uniref:tail fiber domain-containing protein n=1 Tax=Halobacteriovorax sp. DPLXC-1 TaxID=3110771 RepID=UPI002FF41872
MMNLLKQFHILGLIVTFTLVSCVPKIQSRDNNRDNLYVQNIQINGSQLRIDGQNLDDVSHVRITDKDGNVSSFEIGVKSNKELIAEALSNTLIPLNQILTMTLEGAHGASTYSISASLPDMGASHGQTLQYNAITGQWVPANQPTSSVTSVNGKLGAVSLGIDNLSDTDTSGAVTGSVLKFNGVNWVVGTDNGGSSANATSIHNRTILDITPTDGQALVWSSANSSWVPTTVSGGSGGSGESNTVYSTGGTSIFKQKVGSQLQFKGLNGSNDIVVDNQTNSLDLQISTANGANQLLRLDSFGRLPAIDGSQLTGISSGGSGETNTISSAGGVSIFKQKSGENLELKGLQGSSDFAINGSTNTVDFQINTSNGANQLLRLDSSGRLPAIDGSQLTGIVASGGSDNTIQSRNVSATAPSNGQALLWNSVSSQWEPTTITSGGAGGEVNTATSAGGESIFQNKIGTDLIFKGLTNTTDIQLTSNANDIEIGVNTSNGAGQLLRLDAFGRLPAIDGSQLVGVSGGSGDALTLQSRDIATTAPTDGQVLTWNNSTTRWEPQTPLVGGGSGEANTVSSAGGASIFKQKSGIDLVLKGLLGSSDFNITSSTNTVDLSINTSNGANQLLRLDASGRLPALDGSLLTNLPGGSGNATTIQSFSVSSATPANGQALLWNDSNSRWEPTTIVTGGGGGEANTASSAGGESLFQSKVSSNLVFKGLTSTSDISLTGNINDVQIGLTTANGANEILRLDGFGRLPAIDGSQLTGITTSDTTLQSRNVASTAPTDGQVLTWNNTATQWEPQTVSAGGSGETNTASSVGGTAIFKQKTGSDLEFKGLTGSADISLTSNANDVQIGVNTSNSANDLVRLDGLGRLPAIDGSQLTGITGTGEANTLSSAGGTYSLFYQKNGVDLQLKGLNFTSDFAVVDNSTSYSVDINTANGANELVRLEADGSLPALSAANLFNIPTDDTTIQGRNVNAAAPTDGQALLWDSISSQWIPSDVTAAGDNLGDHTATSNLAMGNNYISYSGLDEGLFVNLGGNVGIGTNLPQSDLDIYEANVEVKIRDSNVGVSSEAQVNLFVDGGEAGMSLLNTNYDWFGEGFPDSSWSDMFLFYTGPSSSNGMRFHPFAGNINFSVGDAVFTDIMHVNATNTNVGILTTSPGAAFALDVNGQIRTTTTVDTSSDRRYKKNIKNISSEVSILDKFSLIEGVYFDWRQKEYPEKNFKEGRDIGVIAQDIRKVFPEAVTEDENGFLSVAYAKLVAPLIEAVKELVGITDTNKRDIASIEARTKKLEEENRMLREALCEMNPKAKICLKENTK